MENEKTNKNLWQANIFDTIFSGATIQYRFII